MPTQLYSFRASITEFIHWVKEWDDPDPAVMTQALWLLNLAGVANSGVHETTTLRVLMQMREVSQGRKDPAEALAEMEGWERGQAD